ncbi:MAG: O-antigen ligase domain-containing protein [Actinomycetota bacterium]|nr:O-antigen ligase domain-containing protein [Actinomycetota bacterium]
MTLTVDAIQAPAARAAARSGGGAIVARSVERRVAIIWGLMLFNGIPWLPGPTVIPIPHRVAQLITSSALALAFLLALTINRRLRIRPNALLVLYMGLLVIALITGLRGTAGHGSVFRAVRLSGFLAVLWLLTPWWGRRDMLLLRCHLRALLVVLASVVVGAVIAPGKALGNGRLHGVIWYLPATQVGQFAAVAAGCAVVLWLSGAMSRRPAWMIAAFGLVLIVLTHTRTAALALTTGVLLASFSLILARARVRRVLLTAALVMPLALVAVAPSLVGWATRNQSSADIAGLTGRKAVWATVVSQPRSEFERFFGFGLSDKSSQGRSIDDTWLAVYRDEGLVGDGLIGAILGLLLISAAFRKSGPARAVALFLVVYCAFATYTEVVIGDASPYLLHLVVASALLLAAAQSGDDSSRRAAVGRAALA